MATTLLQEKKQEKQISWGIPLNAGEEITLSDYRAMIKEAERGTGISFEQYTKKTHEWLQKNL